MHIFTIPEGLMPAWVAFRYDPETLSAGFLVKGTFKMAHDGVPELDPEGETACGDVFEDDNPDGVLIHASELVPYKPRADLLVSGAAHAPGGNPMTHFFVGVKMGEFAKQILAIGDRSWVKGLVGRGTFTDPTPFVSMPLTYGLAYGGKKYGLNPSGRGRDGAELPNFEYPDRMLSGPKQPLPPAGLGPLSPAWKPRKDLTGNYDAAWLKERWPGFPVDFDYGYFNAAPEDQQFAEFPTGDETITLTNCHPEHGEYRTRLPGLRVRFFLDENTFGGRPENFREVALHIDTVQLDMDAETMVVVWRGVTDVRHIKLKEVQHILVAAEPLSEPPRSKDEYRDELQKCLHPPDDEEDEDMGLPGAPGKGTVDPDMLDMDRELADVDAASRTFDAQWDAQVQRHAKLHRDPTLATRLAGSPSSGPVLSQRRVTNLNTRAPALSQDYQSMVREVEAGLAETDAVEADFAQGMDASPPKPDETRAQIARGTDLKAADLKGMDLAGVDFSGKELQEADFRDANLKGSRFCRSQLQEAVFDGADLSGADFSEATLDEASFTGATMDANTVFRAASMVESDFSEIEWHQASFPEVQGFGIDFMNAKLPEADFEGAVLRQSDFGEADVTGAVFRNSDMYGVQIEEAVARGCDFEGASIDNLQASDGTDFTASRFIKASAKGSAWEDSILDECVIEDSDFTDAQLASVSMRNAQARRANLANAMFDDAQISASLFEQCNLIRASFERAAFEETQMTGCNLFESSFAEATQGDDTRLDGCNLKGAVQARS